MVEPAYRRPARFLLVGIADRNAALCAQPARADKARIGRADYCDPRAAAAHRGALVPDVAWRPYRALAVRAPATRADHVLGAGRARAGRRAPPWLGLRGGVLRFEGVRGEVRVFADRDSRRGGGDRQSQLLVVEQPADPCSEG